MARTGRPPKSIEQHRAEGTLRKDRHATTPLVMGERVMPKVPRWLPRYEQRAFARLTRDLWASGVLDSADAGLIITAAQALGTMWAMSEDIRENGYKVIYYERGKYGGQIEKTRPNEAVRMRKDASAEFLRCCPELGIGPASRTRLADLGIKGKTPAQMLPGVGAKPTPLKVVKSA